MDEKYFEDGKGGGRSLGGAENFKTGSSDKEIASLSQCLHLHRVLVTSNRSF